MRVRLNTIFANATQRGYPGDIIDVSEAEASDLIAGAYAVAVVASAPAPVSAPPAAAGVAGDTSEAASVDASAAATDISKLSISKVLAAIAAGQFTKEQALALEQKSARPRPSLLAQLSAPTA